VKEQIPRPYQNSIVRSRLSPPERSSFKPAPPRAPSNRLILRASNIRTKTGVVRLLQRKGPDRERKGPERACRPVPVVRKNDWEAPHSAPFRQLARAGKRTSRLGRLAERKRLEPSVHSSAIQTTGHRPHRGGAPQAFRNPLEHGGVKVAEILNRKFTTASFCNYIFIE
jgi:hypothetical protein